MLLDWDSKVNAEGSLDSLCISGAPLMQVLWAMAAVRTYPCLACGSGKHSTSQSAHHTASICSGMEVGKASNIVFPCCALSKACASSSS